MMTDDSRNMSFVKIKTDLFIIQIITQKKLSSQLFSTFKFQFPSFIYVSLKNLNISLHKVPVDLSKEWEAQVFGNLEQKIDLKDNKLFSYILKKSLQRILLHIDADSTSNIFLKTTSTVIFTYSIYTKPFL